jgi:hypothetical protein
VYLVGRTKSNSIDFYGSVLHYHVAPMAKRIIRSAIKVVAASAGAVFLACPVREFNQLLLFVASMAVLLVCLVLWLLLFGNEHTGWWPDKPE